MEKTRYIHLRNQHLNNNVGFLYSYFQENGGNFNPSTFIGLFSQWIGFKDQEEKVNSMVSEKDKEFGVTVMTDLKTQQTLQVL